MKADFLKWLFNFLVFNNSGKWYVNLTLCPFSIRLWKTGGKMLISVIEETKESSNNNHSI